MKNNVKITTFSFEVSNLEENSIGVSEQPFSTSPDTLRQFPRDLDLFVTRLALELSSTVMRSAMLQSSVVQAITLGTNECTEECDSQSSCDKDFKNLSCAYSTTLATVGRHTTYISSLAQSVLSQLCSRGIGQSAVVGYGISESTKLLIQAIVSTVPTKVEHEPLFSQALPPSSLQSNSYNKKSVILLAFQANHGNILERFSEISDIFNITNNPDNFQKEVALSTSISKPVLCLEERKTCSDQFPQYQSIYTSSEYLKVFDSARTHFSYLASIPDIDKMGNCCCKCKRKKLKDGDQYAPEILYFNTENDCTPKKQPLSSSTDSIIRRRQILLNDTDGRNAPLAQHELYSTSSGNRRRGSSTSIDFLSTRENSFKPQLHASMEPIIQDLCQEEVSELKEHRKEQKQSGSGHRSGRRSSLEPIILEDCLGESSHLWLGLQHGESESSNSTERFFEGNFAAEFPQHIDGLESERNSNITLKRQDVSDLFYLDRGKIDSATNTADEKIIRFEDNTLVKENKGFSAKQKLGECTELQQLSSDRIVLHDSDDHSKRIPISTCISSIADPVTRKRYLITSALRRGLLDFETACQLLEGQLLTGGIINIVIEDDTYPSVQHLSVDEANQRDLIDSRMFDRLLTFENTLHKILNFGMSSSEDFSALQYNSSLKVNRRMIRLQTNMGGLFDSKHENMVSLMTAVQRCLIEYSLAEELLSQQIASGGVIRDCPLSRINLMDAKMLGFVEANDASRLRHFEILYHGVRDPNTHEPTTYAMCVRRGILSRQEVVDFLKTQALEHAGWVRNCFTHEWLPITRAMHEGVVDVGMWEDVEQALAQRSCDPVLIHPLWQRPVSYFDMIKSTEPESRSLLNCRVILASNMYEGIYDPRHNERVSLCEALKRDLTDETTAKRLLKAQLESGGLVDTEKHERVPVSEALSRNIIDFPMAVSLVQQDQV